MLSGSRRVISAKMAGELIHGGTPSFVQIAFG
jgi:hypothetical protein